MINKSEPYREGNEMKHLCECGCGQEVTRSKKAPHNWNRFIYGHNVRVENPMSKPEVREKVSIANMGQVPWIKGKKMSEEAKRKISIAHTGKVLTKEHKEKLSAAKIGKPTWNKDKKMSEEYCKTISENQMGRKLTEEWKQSISEALSGKYESVANDSKYCGVWQDEEFRQDCMGDRCENCGATDKLLLHHIDEDKSNCHPDNIQTLCRPCHGRHHATLLWQIRKLMVAAAV